jgi:hypothetical protein
MKKRPGLKVRGDKGGERKMTKKYGGKGNI